MRIVMSVETIRRSESKNKHPFQKDSGLDDATAIKEILTIEYNVLDRFTVREQLEDGLGNNYLWLVTRSSERDIARLACWSLRYKKKPLRHGKEEIFEFDRSWPPGELSESDREHARLVGQYAITKVLLSEAILYEEVPQQDGAFEQTYEEASLLQQAA